MVDPYAPPTEDLGGPTRPPAPGYGAGGQAYETPYARPEAYESPRERRVRHERDRAREPHAEPARPGLFWAVAAVGIGLLCLARLVAFFAIQDEMANDRVAPALFAVLGAITLTAGLALAGMLQRGLSTPVRAALLLGAGFFAIVGLLGIPAFGLL
jgi:hypothetical protein